MQELHRAATLVVFGWTWYTTRPVIARFCIGAGGTQSMRDTTPFVFPSKSLIRRQSSFDEYTNPKRERGCMRERGSVFALADASGWCRRTCHTKLDEVLGH